MEEQVEYQVGPIKRNALIEYDVTPEAVAKMATEYMVLTVPEDDAKAYRTARKALTICVRTRTGTDKRRKELGSDARTWISECNAAAKQLIDPLAPVEEHLRGELEREDARKEAIKEAEEAKERKRIEDIRAMIAEIGNIRMDNFFADSKTLASCIEFLEGIETSESEYQEFWTEAAQVKAQAIEALKLQLEARLVWEKNEAERKEEEARLEKIAEEQRLEQERLDKKREEDRQAADAAAEKLAETERLAREKLDAEAKALEEERAAFDKRVSELDQEVAEQKERSAPEAEMARKAHDGEMEKRAKAFLAPEPEEGESALDRDKAKLIAWMGFFDTVANNPEPDLETDDAKACLQAINDLLEILIQETMEQIKEL